MAAVPKPRFAICIARGTASVSVEAAEEEVTLLVVEVGGREGLRLRKMNAG